MKTNKTTTALLLTLAAVPMIGVTAAHSQELLTNGGFETGDFTGWTVRNFAGSDPSGTFAIGNNNLDYNLTPPSPATPISELATVGAKSGSFYAVSDSLGPGAHVLLQSFTIPTNVVAKAHVSFDMFANDWNGAGAMNQNGALDHGQVDVMSNLIPTQFARVDLLVGGADPFSIAPSDVLQNLFDGEDYGVPANDYTHYDFDISQYVTAGDTYQLRFSEVDNQFTLNQGVDNVSVTMQTPEPGSVGFALGMGITGAAMFRGRRRASKSKI